MHAVHESRHWLQEEGFAAGNFSPPAGAAAGRFFRLY
jgi:hypothetical protein